MSETERPDFDTGYEASEEESKSIEQESKAVPAGRQKTKSRTRQASAVGASRPGRQMTLFDLDRQLDRQRRLLETVADNVRHMKKQLNQVQRDLVKSQKRLGKGATRNNRRK